MSFRETALQLIEAQKRASADGHPLASKRELRRIVTSAGSLTTLALSAAELHKRAANVDPNPTPAKASAGNFAKGHLSWRGFPIAIEVKKGGYRRGIGRDGQPWQSLMERAHYGYLKKYEGADGEKFDCFLCDGTGPGESLDSDIVFVVNQIDPATGKFDESKLVLGCVNKKAAKEVYLSSYRPGWKGCGSIVELTLPQLRHWLEKGDQSKPLSETHKLTTLSLPQPVPEPGHKKPDPKNRAALLLAYVDALIDAEHGDHHADQEASHLLEMLNEEEMPATLSLSSVSYEAALAARRPGQGWIEIPQGPGPYGNIRSPNAYWNPKALGGRGRKEYVSGAAAPQQPGSPALGATPPVQTQGRPGQLPQEAPIPLGPESQDRAPRQQAAGRAPGVSAPKQAKQAGQTTAQHPGKPSGAPSAQQPAPAGQDQEEPLDLGPEEHDREKRFTPAQSQAHNWGKEDHHAADLPNRLLQHLRKGHAEPSQQQYHQLAEMVSTFSPARLVQFRNLMTGAKADGQQGPLSAAQLEETANAIRTHIRQQIHGGKQLHENVPEASAESEAHSIEQHKRASAAMGRAVGTPGEEGARAHLEKASQNLQSASAHHHQRTTGAPHVPAPYAEPAEPISAEKLEEMHNKVVVARDEAKAANGTPGEHQARRNLIRATEGYNRLSVAAAKQRNAQQQVASPEQATAPAGQSRQKPATKAPDVAPSPAKPGQTEAKPTPEQSPQDQNTGHWYDHSETPDGEKISKHSLTGKLNLGGPGTHPERPDLDNWRQISAGPPPVLQHAKTGELREAPAGGDNRPPAESGNLGKEKAPPNIPAPEQPEAQGKPAVSSPGQKPAAERAAFFEGREPRPQPLPDDVRSQPKEPEEHEHGNPTNPQTVTPSPSGPRSSAWDNLSPKQTQDIGRQLNAAKQAGPEQVKKLASQITGQEHATPEEAYGAAKAFLDKTAKPETPAQAKADEPGTVQQPPKTSASGKAEDLLENLPEANVSELLQAAGWSDDWAKTASAVGEHLPKLIHDPGAVDALAAKLQESGQLKVPEGQNAGTALAEKLHSGQRVIDSHIKGETAYDDKEIQQETEDAERNGKERSHIDEALRAGEAAANQSHQARGESAPAETPGGDAGAPQEPGADAARAAEQPVGEEQPAPTAEAPEKEQPDGDDAPDQRQLAQEAHKLVSAATDDASIAKAKEALSKLTLDSHLAERILKKNGKLKDERFWPDEWKSPDTRAARHNKPAKGPGLFDEDGKTPGPPAKAPPADQAKVTRTEKPQIQPEPQEHTDLAKHAPEQIDGAFARAWKDQTLTEEQRDGVVELPNLYSQLKSQWPSLTREQFNQHLQKMWDERKLDLMVLNEVRDAKPGEGIKRGDNLYYFAKFRGGHADRLEKHAPSPAAQKQPAAPKPEQSGFASGFDKAMTEQERDIANEGGKVSIPHLYHAMRAENPKLSSTDFHAQLQRMADAGQIEVHPEPNERKMTEPTLALDQGEKGKGYYVTRPSPEQRKLIAAANPVQQSHEPVKPQNAPEAKLAPPPAGQKIIPPPTPTKEVHTPDPTLVDPKTGITRASRVGVLPGSAPPPPHEIKRLPNLVEDERRAETNFAERYLNDPDGMVAEYRRKQNAVTGKDKDGNPTYEIGDAPNIFNSDDAKMLSHDYHPPEGTPEEQMKAKALFNTAVHQTANALSKKAFTAYLDEVAKMPEDKRTVLVTSGGVASGKGYSLKSTPKGREMQQLAGAVWDATGEANATENHWVLTECKNRGLKVQYAFIHANPEVAFGRMLSRAAKIGRTVDVLPMADSYSIGAKNFHAFHQANKNDPNVEFIIMDSSGKDPVEVPEVPASALQHKPDELYSKLSAMIDQKAPELPAHVVHGATRGRGIWQEPGTPDQKPPPPPPAA